MSYLCRCGNLLSYPKSLREQGKRHFSRQYRWLFNRTGPLYGVFSIEFSTACEKHENFLAWEYFFVFSTKRTEFIHRLFHNLWKTFVPSPGGLSYLSRFFGTSCDISATKLWHFVFFILSYRQNDAETGILRGFFPLFHGFFRLFRFSTWVFHRVWENLWKTFIRQDTTDFEKSLQGLNNPFLGCFSALWRA